jgi:hypothetical protein
MKARDAVALVSDSLASCECRAEDTRTNIARAARGARARRDGPSEDHPRPQLGLYVAYSDVCSLSLVTPPNGLLGPAEYVLALYARDPVTLS